jgi:hypothetical protein
MQVAPEVRDLEALAEARKVPMSRALTRAGVSLSTYWRWRHEGKEPLTGTIRKVRAAIHELADAA